MKRKVPRPVEGQCCAKCRHFRQSYATGGACVAIIQRHGRPENLPVYVDSGATCRYYNARPPR